MEFHYSNNSVTEISEFKEVWNFGNNRNPALWNFTKFHVPGNFELKHVWIPYFLNFQISVFRNSGFPEILEFRNYQKIWNSENNVITKFQNSDIYRMEFYCGTCTQSYMSAYMHTCFYTNSLMHVYLHACIHMHTHTQTLAHLPTYIHACWLACLHTYMCICIHTT